MTLEQRRNLRVPIEEMVELTVEEDSNLNAACLNISRTGLLLKTNTFLSPSATVSLRLNIPFGFDSYNFRCQGVVVRADEDTGRYLIGLKFNALPDEDSQVLDGFLKMHERVPQDDIES